MDVGVDVGGVTYDVRSALMYTVDVNILSSPDTRDWIKEEGHTLSEHEVEEEIVQLVGRGQVLQT